jgi:hypothetical protein
MSKDKGVKNIKKAPADKTKVKAVSSYKAESKSSSTTVPTKPSDKTKTN